MSIPFLSVKPQAIRLKVKPQFPSLVNASSPLTLDQSNGNFLFGLDINALKASLDASYLPTEGQWTPALSFDTPGNFNVAYSQQLGHYIKIGRLVIAWFSITTTTFTHTTASGSLIISGLPFAGEALFGAGTGIRGGVVNFQGITKAGYSVVIANLNSASPSTFNLAISGSGVGSTNVAATDMPTGGSVVLRGNLMYIAD